MEMNNVMQQAPIRNESVVGAHVYSHSGEFSPQVTDMALMGRGISFRFIRKHCSSRCQGVDPLGRGWTFTYAKRIERQGHGILYHDGLGRTHRFTRALLNDDFISPPGFYAVLRDENGKLLLRH